jgi:hypothetical protein
MGWPFQVVRANLSPNLASRQPKREAKGSGLARGVVRFVILALASALSSRQKPHSISTRPRSSVMGALHSLHHHRFGARFGDIIIPVPAPPTNADPMNLASPGDVVTQRYNNLRTGTTLHSGLDPSAVSVDSFGLVGKLEVDGVVLAQPLFVESVDFPNKGRRPAVFIATSTNNVYAFDADTLESLWDKPTFLGNPYRIVDAFTDANLKNPRCQDLMASTEQDGRGANTTVVLGIESTPVIDSTRSRIIVSYRTTDRKSDKFDVPDDGAQRIAALDLRTGQFVKGPDGHDLDQRVEDNPIWNAVHRNRAGLLLDQDHVYVAFSGRCENMSSPLFGHKSYRGWIYAFKAENLAFLGRYRSTRQPTGTPPIDPVDDPVMGGGIWQGAAGIAADGHGNLFFATGNETRCDHNGANPNRPNWRTCGAPDAFGKNLSNSVVRLRVDPA